MKNLLIFFVIIFSHTFYELQAQSNSPILGIWIKKGSIADNMIESPFSDNEYLKYEFHKNGLLYFSNNYLERGVPSKYRITQDNKLSLNYLLYNLISFTGDQLVIADEQNTQIHLIKVKELAANEFKLSSGDVVYKSNFNFHPTLNSNVDLYNYFFSAKEYLDQLTTTFDVSSAVNTMKKNTRSNREDIIVKVNFIVNRNGDVERVKLLDSSIPQNEQKFISKIERTSGFWTPALLNGRAVDTELTLTFVKLGTKTTDNHSKADLLFTKGIRFYEKEKYEKSLDAILDAISIWPTNERYYFGRAQVYFKMKKTEDACEDLMRIKKYNLVEVEKQIKNNCKN